MSGFYSEQPGLADDLRFIARAIEARKGDRFQTRFLAEDAAEARMTWHEAWKNPVTRTWEVSKHISDGKDIRKQALYRNLCFFDALHLCAMFEASSGNYGCITVDRPFTNGQVHYTDFAAAEGIPFDRSTGLPLLAAYGRIVGEGDYDDAALKTAEKSQADIKSPPAPEDLSAFSGRNLPAVISGAKDMSIDAERNRAELGLKANGLTNKLYPVMAALQDCRSAKFRSKDAKILWAPLIPVIGQILVFIPDYWRDVRNQFPNAAFRSSIRSLRREYNKVSGLLDIAPLEQFANDAVLTFHILRARQAGCDYVAGKGSERKVNKCIKAFSAAASADGWDNYKIADMVNRIKTDVGNKDLDNKIVNGLEESRQKVRTYIESCIRQS